MWQSTWFVFAAWLLALLVRKDAARIRYWIWCAASLKFVVPFSALTWLGSQFIFQVDDESAFLPLVQHVTAPLTSPAVAISPAASGTQTTLIALWALGSTVLLFRWLVHWLQARALVHNSIACALNAPIPVHRSAAVLEPCVVGVRDPVLLIPTHLLAKLTPPQLDAVIAHELSHVRRKDNLTATVHAAIAAVFWFHPLIWWVGAKLIELREHACDESVLQGGIEPTAYAEAILSVCDHAVQSRLTCVATATGGDLNARIRSIMTIRRPSRFKAVRRTLLFAALLGCVTLPVAAGMTVIATSNLTVAAGTRSIRISDRSGPAFINTGEDHVYARNVSLRELISHAYAVRERDVKGDPRRLDHTRYHVDLRLPAGAAVDLRVLVADLLDQQFNLELIASPTQHAQ
ncbi:MAG TPA: M56 family metallopeptidase [Steroidobacteraceae bacterium]|nr:M56 family metallopeptidase [Steroidobacteraceae bacterium]